MNVPRHYIYRAFDADDRLLYVGHTHTPIVRMRAHETRSYWWPFHSYVVFSEPMTLEDAKAAERSAVASEHPRWNVQHRSKDHPDGAIPVNWGRHHAAWLRTEIDAWFIWRDATGCVWGAA